MVGAAAGSGEVVSHIGRREGASWMQAQDPQGQCTISGPHWTGSDSITVS